MDIMVILQIIVLLGAIFVGVRLGGIGIGYAGGAGVLILGLCLGMKPGNIPWDVILIIASVISAISAMQLAGGLDYLVYIAEKILYKNPKYINYLAPLVTYCNWPPPLPSKPVKNGTKATTGTIADAAGWQARLCTSWDAPTTKTKWACSFGERFPTAAPM